MTTGSLFFDIVALSATVFIAATLGIWALRIFKPALLWLALCMTPYGVIMGLALIERVRRAAREEESLD